MSKGRILPFSQGQLYVMSSNNVAGVTLAILAKRFSTAVSRNKAKRRIREAVRRELLSHISDDIGLHIVARVETIAPSYDAIRACVSTVRKRKLWIPKT